MRTITKTFYDQEDVSAFYNEILEHPQRVIDELDRIEEGYIGMLCQDEEFEEFEYQRWKNASVLRAAARLIEKRY